MQVTGCNAGAQRGRVADVGPVLEVEQGAGGRWRWYLRDSLPGQRLVAQAPIHGYDTADEARRAAADLGSAMAAWHVEARPRRYLSARQWALALAALHVAVAALHVAASVL